MTSILALSIGSALLWGLFATGVLTLLMSTSQGLGWSRMSFPFMIGSMFTSHRGRAMALGFGLHIVFGLAFALLYALVFESWQWATWWLGGLLGVFHGLFLLIVLMPALPDLHPRMASPHYGPTPTRQLEPPGFMALNYGRNTPALTLAAHVVYGILLGLFYPLG
ncbi:MAG: hypothetical protein ABEK75_06595 [Salinibacter sp.]